MKWSENDLTVTETINQLSMKTELHTYVCGSTHLYWTQGFYEVNLCILNTLSQKNISFLSSAVNVSELADRSFSPDVSDCDTTSHQLYRQSLLLQEIHDKFRFPVNPQPDHPAAYPTEDLPHGSVYSLDSNHSHFVMIEEDPQRSGATSDMRVKLLKHISLQRTGYGGTEPHFTISVHIQLSLCTVET